MPLGLLIWCSDPNGIYWNNSLIILSFGMIKQKHLNKTRDFNSFMEIKKFDVKAFWKEMKELFPEIDLNSIKEDSKQWATMTKPIVLKRVF